MWDKEKHRTRTICGTKKSLKQGQYVGQRKAQNKDNMEDKKNIEQGQYVGQRKTYTKDNMWDKEKHKTRTIWRTKKSIKQGQYVGQRKA